jgi:4-amino-4-deoxy-L-arabinose transferase-like glycosyltransferase
MARGNNKETRSGLGHGALARRHLYLFLILALAYVLNGLGIWWEPGQPDEIVYRSLPREGVWEWHPHTFKFPSLHLYTIRVFAILPSIVLHRAGYIGERYWQFALFLGRGITLVMSLGVVLLTYLIGRRVFNTKVGLLGALLLASNYLFVNDAHFATTDVPALFWTLAALYAAVLLHAGSRLKGYVVCGVLIGLAISAKYMGAVVLLVAAAQLILWTVNRHLTIRQLVGRVALLTACAALAFVATSPYFVLDAKHAIADILYIRGERLGVEKTYAFASTLQLLPKRLWMILTPAWFLLFIVALGYHVFCIKRRRLERAFPLLVYLGVFIVLFELVWNMTYRLHLVFVPVIALITASFIFRLDCWARRKIALRNALWGLFALFVASLLIRSGLITYYFMNDTRVQAEQYILRHTPKGSLFSFATEFPMYFPRIKASDRLLPVQMVDPHERQLEEVLRELGVGYIVTSSLWSFQATGKEKDLYEDLDADKPPYKRIARFERESFLGLKPRAIEFISPTIAIYALPDNVQPE